MVARRVRVPSDQYGLTVQSVQPSTLVSVALRPVTPHLKTPKNDHPTMADRLLVALQADAPRYKIERWPDFVRELAPASDGAPGRLMPPDLTDAARDELAGWRNLHERLRPV